MAAAGPGVIKAILKGPNFLQRLPPAGDIPVPCPWKLSDFWGHSAGSSVSGSLWFFPTSRSTTAPPLPALPWLLSILLFAWIFLKHLWLPPLCCSLCLGWATLHLKSSFSSSLNPSDSSLVQSVFLTETTRSLQAPQKAHL